MSVRKELIYLDRVGRRQTQAQWPEPGTPVENKQAITAADFDARRIAAIAQGLRAGTGYGAAHAPKT